MNNVQHITSLVDDWVQSEESANVSRLKELLTNDFLGIGPKGFVLTAEQWLQRFNGGFKYESIEVKEVQVKHYEHAAVVVAKYFQKATFQANRSDGEFRLSQTWIWMGEGEKWALAGLQLIAIDANIPNPGKRP